MTEVVQAELVQILQSRARDFPTLSLDLSNVSQSLINLFQALDEKYFQLSNNYVSLKQELDHATVQIQSARILKQQGIIVVDQNSRLTKQVAQLSSKVHELQETNTMNLSKLAESVGKVFEQEQLLLTQSEEIMDLGQKCADLQNLKYRLEERLKETSQEKQLIEVSLNKEIAEIQVVRDRQKTQIKDVTKEIKSYYEELNNLQSEKINLTKSLTETEKQLFTLREEYFRQSNSKNILELQNQQLRKKYEEIQQKLTRLQDKEDELQQMRIENTNLKQKQGSLDLMLQTLSSEKNKLNSEINRMTMQAKANRKYSDNESINTDTAFEHVTQSFRYQHYNPNEENNLNKSSHEIVVIEPRRMSRSSDMRMNRSSIVDEGISWEQERIADLENRKNELERTVRQLRRKLEEQELKNEISVFSEPVVLFQQSPPVYDNDLVVTQINQLSISNDQIKFKNLTLHNHYNLTILPELTLLSLYSLPALKIKPKLKSDIHTQTIQQQKSQKSSISNSFQRPKPQIKLSFDEVEITERKTSSSPRSESFFDKLSRMFCGGPSL